MRQQNRIVTNYPITTAPLLEMEMEVVFGTPSQNCIGSGICMVMSRLPRHQKLTCAHAPARISYQFGKLIFRFKKEDIVHPDWRQRFEAVCFDVQEPYVLPRLMVRKLGMGWNTVAKGVYQVTDTTDEWTIVFQNGGQAAV